MSVNFSVSPQERILIEKLANRALAIDVKVNQRYARKIMDWQMDLTAVHANGCPLRLESLSEADDFNFSHDVFGIARYLNRETGTLQNHFRPRYAQKISK